MSLLLWMLAGALIGVTIYEVYISHIDKETAIDAAKSVMTKDEFSKVLKMKVKEKDKNTITLDMLDSESDSICEVKITGEYISEEIKKSDVIYV